MRWGQAGVAVACGAVVVAVLGSVVASGAQRFGGAVVPAGGVMDVSAAGDGEWFPEFSLTGADGQSITKASLAGKKSLIWLTKSTCPDAEGMRQVAGLDDELGGEVLRVVMVLVDEREPSPWFGAWRDGFGRPDWLVAANDGGSLSASVAVPSVESKFLLDEHGSLIDMTSRLVDADYVGLLRERVSS